MEEKMRKIRKRPKGILLISLIIILLVLQTACSIQGNQPDPAETIERFFSKLNKGEFQSASELCHFEPASSYCLDFAEESFVTNFEQGAKVYYEILSLTDGSKLDGLRLEDPRGKAYYFPDEREDECKTYLSIIRYHIGNKESDKEESFVLSQKISVEKVDDRWVMGKIRYPSDSICTEQVAKTIEQNELDSSTPENLLDSWYQFVNDGNVDDATKLIAENAVDNQKFLAFAKQDLSIGETWRSMVGIEGTKTCPDFDSEHYEDCVQVNVLEQSFYGAGFHGQPSGSVLLRTYELVLTENGWRLWRLIQ